MGRYVSGSTRLSVTRFIDHMRVPLYRNGYALVFSSFTTSGLGMVFWMLAARQYSSHDVGLNAAVLSAINLVATIAQLNLMHTLNRFIPTAGKATFRLIGYSYLISMAVALVAGLAFVVGIGAWSPSLSILKSSSSLSLFFILSVVTWVIYVIQDGVLTGLRQALWVPVGNFFFSLIKLALLVALAAALPKYGLWVSWTMASVITLLPVNFLIFRRFIPQHIETTETVATPIERRQLITYSIGDYVGTLALRTTDSLLPLIVVERVSASANAHYYLSWTIAYSIFLISRNMGMSLITEAAVAPKKLGAFGYSIMIQVARMVIPAVIILIIGAPYILRLFGQDYSTEGTTVFRLLCLSAIPNIVINLYLSIARVQRRISKIILVQVVLSMFLLSLSYILLEAQGITGIGIAMLVSQTVIAIALWFTELRAVWLLYWNIQFLLWLLRYPRKLWWYWKHRHHIRAAHDLLPKIISTVPDLPDAPPPATWKIHPVLQTVTDVTVFPLGAEGQTPVALLKVTYSKQGSSSLQQQSVFLKQLHNDPRLGDLNSLLPAVLSADRVDDERFYVIERRLPGVDSRHVISDLEIRERVLRLAVSTVMKLHQNTARSIVVDKETLQRWVDEPLSYVRQVCMTRADSSEKLAVVDRLTTQLYDALEGRKLTVSWIHGDFVPGNILVAPDGTQVTGLLDWDLAAPDELPPLDVMLLLLSTRMIVEKREIGHVVCRFLEGADWTPFEHNLLNMVQPNTADDPVDMRTLLLLCWLRHVAANLKKTSHSATHWVWVTWNIESVLKCI